MDYDVIIIGSGLGGLLCGNILSREGFNVCIVEKNHKAGGSLQTFGRKGCIFNTGLNYTESLDSGQILNQYFRYFGLMGLPFRRLDADGFEVISFNDERYPFAMGSSAFIETLARRFPEERQGLNQYADKIRQICEHISLYNLREEQLSIHGNYDLSAGAADYIRSVIHNPRLQNVLAGNNMLYSGNENRTPLFIHALINHSFIESAWRVVDGSHQLVHQLVASFKANGGTLLTGSKAVRLTGVKENIATAVLENGMELNGRHFISAIHPEGLLNIVDPGLIRKAFKTRIDSLEDTMGMFSVYIVFKKNTFPYMNHNFYHFNQDNVWVASNYGEGRWPQNYLFMNTATSRSSTWAESGTIITYMHYDELQKWVGTRTGDRGNEYLEFKNRKAEVLIEAVEAQFPGLHRHIEAFYTSTPLTWRDFTGTRAGSAYGVLKDYQRPLESVIMPRTKVPNLYMTGQNTNVHGILGVTISSVVTCGELLDIQYLIRKIRQA
jgi:all-trans-retinol 13,14-reductase